MYVLKSKDPNNRWQYDCKKVFINSSVHHKKKYLHLIYKIAFVINYKIVLIDYVFGMLRSNRASDVKYLFVLNILQKKVRVFLYSCWENLNRLKFIHCVGLLYVPINMIVLLFLL